MRWGWLHPWMLGWMMGALACGEMASPPGRSMDSAAEPTTLTLPPAEPSAVTSAALPSGTARVASIAMRTWVYMQPDPESTKLGYLRAGALVPRSADPAGKKGCDGGWYGIEPRGYVCVGKGASLDLKHRVVQAAPRGPRRGEPMPYTYVISRKPPPHLYFRLPTLEQQERAEGEKRAQSLALFAATSKDAFGAPDVIPSFLGEGDDLPKPYGAERPLHYEAHRGRAREESAFGVMATFGWTDRVFGLTTELDLIPMDRTRRAALSDMTGVEVPDGGTPAFVAHHGVLTYKPDALGQLQATGEAPHRSGWVLTGKNNGAPTGLVETTAGVWLPAASLRIAKVREDRAGYAREGRKWIDVSIKQQLLVAYEGTRPVFATLVSTGRGEMGDPEKTTATVRGTFMIAAKHVSGTMDGDREEEPLEPFDLHDVPYIQYFYKGYALHGAYWHDDFGKVRSHGCVNLSPRDAAWLFEWTEPQVPEGWHGALNPNGTLVFIHA